MCRLLEERDGRGAGHEVKKGGRHGECSSLLDLRGTTVYAKSDEVVGVERQSMVGLFGKI